MNNNPKDLVGFCDKCEVWYKFTDNPKDESSRLHLDCGERPSTRNGYQLTTQRTFNPNAKKLTKAQLKRLGS